VGHNESEGPALIAPVVPKVRELVQPALGQAGTLWDGEMIY